MGRRPCVVMLMEVTAAILVWGLAAGADAVAGQAAASRSEAQAPPLLEKPAVAHAPAPLDKPAVPPRTRAQAISILASSYTMDLPWLRRDLSRDMPQQTRYFKFEASRLDLPPGEYTVALVPYDVRRSLSVRLESGPYRDVPVRGGRAELTGVHIRDRILRLYLKAEFVVGKSPLSQVLVYPSEITFAEAEVSAVPFRQYQRATPAEQPDDLGQQGTPELAEILNRQGFGAQQVRAMGDAILAWCARHQVLDAQDPRLGAICSDETSDACDCREAAAAAVLFAQAWRDTGQQDWRRRALLAWDYAYKAQCLDDPKDQARYGGFRQRACSGKTSAELPDAPKGLLPTISGPNTCIMIHLLSMTTELGLPPAADEAERIAAAAQWICQRESQPGVFRLGVTGGLSKDAPRATAGSSSSVESREGPAYDALAALALVQAHAAVKRLGKDPPDRWLEAARRAILRCLAAPPDQAMGLYALVAACQMPALRDAPGVEEAMNRIARSWLARAYVNRDPPLVTIDLDDPSETAIARTRRGSSPSQERERRSPTEGWSRADSVPGAVAPSGWRPGRPVSERLLAAATLVRIAQATGQTQPWQAMALRLTEHIRAKLWKQTLPEQSPGETAGRGKSGPCGAEPGVAWDGVLLRQIETALR